MAAGVAALTENDYYMNNCKRIIETREYTKQKLNSLGFVCTNSQANFLFACHEKISGEELYLSLKASGILVRHFNKEKIFDYNRITVGTREEMDALLFAIEKILKEKNV
jgi:histidinol-phosphate aminotransferase